jgi:hypothetical protein
VLPSTTGTAQSATTVRPIIDASTVPVATITTRRSLRRPTTSSPASPDAASSPVSATVATTAAKIRLSHCGASPSSIEFTISPGS